MCQQLTGKAFFAVERDPGELAAVIIQESRSQADTFFLISKRPARTQL